MSHYFLLIYNMSADYLEKRDSYRNDHLEHLRKYVSQDTLMMGGAVGEVIEKALLIFNTEDQRIVEECAISDPYVINKIVTSWQILPWHVVIGAT